MRHGVVCSTIATRLAVWADRGSKGYAASNNPGVVTERDPDSVRGPDCLFVAADRVPGKVPIGFLEIPPDLAMEVLSPDDRWSEVIAKVSEYLSCGVREVWVADLVQKELQVFRPDQRPVTLSADAEITSESILPGFRCRVGDFFPST